MISFSTFSITFWGEKMKEKKREVKCPTSHFPGYVARWRGEEFVKRGCEIKAK
jgi:hypothetical protein